MFRFNSVLLFLTVLIDNRVLHGSGSRNVPRESRGISRRIGIDI